MTDLNARPEGLTFPVHLLPSVSLDEEDREELLSTLWQEILRGEDDVELYAELLQDHLDDEEIPDEQAHAVAEYLMDARRAQQATFGEVPESRLATAFEALRRAKVVAEMDFTCCGTCGAAEIGAEQAEAGDFDQWLGYVFFHEQDTESLIESGEVCLNYGLFWPAHVSEEEFNAMSDRERDRTYDRLTLKLMKEVVVPIFEEHGIEVVWDGSMSRRIRLKGVDYYVPFPPR